MRVYTYEPEGPRYRLALAERTREGLGPHQVRLAVHACSINYRDHIALHNLAGRKVAGVIPLSDGAGQVIEVGAHVTLWKPGDRAAGLFFQTWQQGAFELAHHKHDLGGNLNGMLAEEVVLPETGLTAIPEHLSYVEAACLPCAGLTAWNALVTRGGLRPGAEVLVQGCGGVSLFALQIAAAMGCRTLVTSSSDDKLARAKTLGAAETINYRSRPDWEKEVWRLTKERGVDHVVEVGGPGTLEKSLQCVAAGGQIALIGVLTGFGPPQTSLFPLMARNARLDGIYVGSKADFTRFNAFLSEKQLHPVIDSIYSFEEATEAFARLASGSHFGKVVIQINR